jgi:cobalt/nickel transport system permease protein
MGGGHSHVGSLHDARDTPVHATAATVKLVALVGFLLAVVATPARAVWAFGLDAALVMAAAGLAAIPMRVLARRLLIEVPFVVFALALPFVGVGPYRQVVAVSVSVPGMWAGWGILAKATLGTASAVVLAWSTPVADLLAGLDRLRVPRALTAIAGFMVRYLDVVSGELRRLQVARVSRGDDPRWFWQGRAVAANAGTLFVRSFERGERVQQAMAARGFTGQFPATVDTRVPLVWFPAVVWPVTAGIIASLAVVLT